MTQSNQGKPEKELAPEPIGVAEIPIGELYANPHNPRMLFDEAPLKILQDSIGKVGILVPLTVYQERKTGRFIILDGQRRWIAAQNLGLETIPVNRVAEPTLVQNIVTMFQIHKFREDWELMPTALKLEVLMKELSERNERKLSALTGLDRAVVTRCKKLLSYSRKYQAMMLDPDPSARIKADFFIELYAVRNDKFINTLKWFTRNEFTDRMLNRYKSKSGLKSVTDFRIIKQHVSNARRAGKQDEIAKKLRDFQDDETLGIEHLNIKAADISAEARKLEANVNSLIDTLRAIESKDFYGEENLWKKLRTLADVIYRKLEDAGKRI